MIDHGSIWFNKDKDKNKWYIFSILGAKKELISGKKLPIQARIIAIADVFEGLTAPDRPYKKGYKLSKALKFGLILIISSSFLKTASP